MARRRLNSSLGNPELLPTIRQQIIVRVPASTSNLGPGFDALGLALNIYNDFTVDVLGGGDGVVCELQGRGRLAGLQLCGGGETGEALNANPFFTMFRRVFEFAGREAPRVRVTVDAQVPPGAGLGSSATARVAAALVADHLLHGLFTREQLLGLVIEAEGHPDNATPALYGGLTLTAQTSAGALVHGYEPAAPWHFVLHVPDYELATHKARKALPGKVRHADAAFNLARVPLVIDALVQGDARTLGLVLEDRLHEPYRAPLIKRHDALREAARGAGAAACFISGAGAGIAAVCWGRKTAERVAEALRGASAGGKFGFEILILQAEAEGARLAEVD